MRFNVTFVVGTSVSLRQQWLVELLYQQVAAALTPYGIQKARAICFGRIVQEIQPLLLAEPLPKPLPALGDGDNLVMGLQLAHAVADSRPTLVVVLHHLFGVGNRIPAVVRQARGNIAHIFLVNNNAQGTHNQGLTPQLNELPCAAVIVPTAHGSRTTLDLLLAEQVDKWGPTA